ncbi:MAG: hypothetical protein L6Q49_16045 [Anaerolineales bacterium]|nr:hypothetical protein [Anaerolineales bacterium]
MTTMLLNQLGIIPAILITLTGLLILRGEDKERNTPRFLLFLLGVMVLFQLALLIIRRFFTEPYNQPIFQATWLLAPSILGILALILLNARTAWRNMNRRTRAATGLLALVTAALSALNWNPQWGLEFLILPGALILSIGWALGRRHPRLAVILSLFSIAILLYTHWTMTHPLDYNDPNVRVFGMVLYFPLFVIPGLSVVMSAVLLTGSLAQDDESPSRFHRTARIAFGAGLILYLAYIIYLGSVWDQTDDGLFGLFFTQPSAITAIGAGMIMILILRGKSRLAGIFFMIVVPILLNQSFEAGWRVSYHEITEGRAERIASALDQFHAREGNYPESLNELTPRDLLFIQQPVILAGEEWCYESGGNYYRLAAFYREFFSAPVSLRLYESAGEVPSSPMPCEERLAEMKGKYYSPMEDPNAMRPPIPTPLPEIDVEMPRTEVQPLLDGASAFAGSWSPDGLYFVFGTQGANTTIHFLNGNTGVICTAESQFSRMDGLREHYAWLPDGRILFIDTAGGMVVLTPCNSEVERLTNRFNVTFTQIGAYAPESGRLLLRSDSAYWVLDSRTLEARLIPEVAPNPYEFHWDRYVWLPGGERLVIARLDGRQGSNAGSTLYLIDGHIGEVLKSHFMEGEWLIMDFSADQVTFTNVLEDIFGLDIKFPDDVSASGSHLEGDGSGYYLAVRLNHPRNQATYLYSSRTGQRYVYDHEHHTLLIFPDGYLMEMPKLETTSTYRDEYNIVMVNNPETAQPRLTLTGHTPREYPHLSIEYLPHSSRLAVASAHGVSLVSLPDGEMLAYWSLVGDGFSPWITASPDGSALVAVKELGGLYYISLR